MSEYREALQKLAEYIEYSGWDLPYYIDCGGCNSNIDASDESHHLCAYHAAKALLARPHIDWEGRYRFLIENRESVEPDAAEKARERNIAMTVCHAITDNCVMVDDPERPECTADNCAAMKALKGCSEVKPSPPAATGEKCVHDLQLPNHTINVLGPLDAVCKVCKEEWHIPGDKP